MTQKELVDMMARILKQDGYYKLGRTWYLEKSDIVSVIQLEKSRWGDQFDIAVAFHLLEIEAVQRPKMHLCHLQSGLSVMPEPNQPLKDALDLERQDLADSDREFEIVKALDGYLNQYVRPVSSLVDLRRLHSQNAFELFLIWLQARAKLEEQNEHTTAVE